MRQPRALVLAAAAFLFAGTAAGQSVTGDVVASGTREPIRGAYVVLVDAAGVTRGAVLTNAAGRFILPVAVPGRYSLSVEYIGYETSLVTGLDVVTGETVTRRIELATRAILIEAIAVEGDGRCRIRGGVGADTHRVWDEVRKALAIVVWGEAERGTPHQAVLFQRNRDLQTDRLIEDGEHAWQPRSGFGRVPFRTAPVEELSQDGYVHARGGDAADYFGLDAQTLLSDEFLDRHCFRLRPGAATDELIGLEFSPLPGSDLPDVAGVLRVDRATLELRNLEYNFTRHPQAPGVPARTFGGTTSFQRLENGAWVVDRWSLRMPQFVIIPEQQLRTNLNQSNPWLSQRDPLAAPERKLVVREEGAELRFIGQPDGRTGTASLEGVVFDSTRMRPLPGARVFVTGTTRSTTTAIDGRYRMTGLPDGPQQVGLFHQHADALGLPPLLQTLELTAGATTTLPLALGSEWQCPQPAEPDPRPQSGRGAQSDPRVRSDPRAQAPRAPAYPGSDELTGMIVGFVLDSGDGSPVAGAPVSAAYRVRRRWTTADALRGYSPYARVEVHAEADADGRFMLCALPVGADIELRARGGPVATAEIGPRGWIKRDLLTARAARQVDRP